MDNTVKCYSKLDWKNRKYPEARAIVVLHYCLISLLEFPVPIHIAEQEDIDRSH